MMSLDFVILCAFFLPVWVILYYTIPYLTTYRPLQSIPGPITNKLSNIPLALSARRGKKFAYIHNLHEQHGPIVRIGFNHISIASERALNVVYGHGNGFLKDDFYDAFVSGVPGVFSTRDRTQHARNLFPCKALGSPLVKAWDTLNGSWFSHEGWVQPRRRSRDNGSVFAGEGALGYGHRSRSPDVIRGITQETRNLASPGRWHES